MSSSGVASPVSVAFSGMGFDFSVAVSGSTSISVAAGQTANYTVTINPASGAQGSFTYKCGTLPANALCVFNPATTTVSAGATGSVMVQISTGKSGSARMVSPPAGACSHGLWTGAAAVGVWDDAGKPPQSAHYSLSGGVGFCWRLQLHQFRGEHKGGSGGSGVRAVAPLLPLEPTPFRSQFLQTGISHGVTVTLIVD